MNRAYEKHSAWIDCITRNGMDAFVVLSAYFDESYREHHDLFLVTGTLFFPRRAKRLSLEWEKRFPGGFHATKFNLPPISLRDQESLRWAAQAIGADAEYVTCVSCSADAAEAAFGKTKAGAQAKAYLACGMLAAMGMAKFLRERNRPDRIAYVYDQGRKGEAELTLNELFDRIYQDDEMREIYRFTSQTMSHSEDQPLLQVADYVSWEFGFDRVARDTKTTQRVHFYDLINELRRKGRARRPKDDGLYYAEYGLDDLLEASEWFAGLRVNIPILQPRTELST
jgi:Protein of unknown function (DUF3800)